MNAKQKEKLLKLIADDCEIRHRYFHEGKTCVIGRMCLDAGIELPARVVACADDRINAYSDISTKLVDHYGLVYGFHLTEMQELNDNAGTIEARRARLTAYVHTIPITEL